MSHRSFIDPLESRRHFSASSTTNSASVGTAVAIDVPFAHAKSSVASLNDTIYKVVHDDDVPGGAAGVIQDGELVALGDAGKRVRRRPEMDSAPKS